MRNDLPFDPETMDVCCKRHGVTRRVNIGQAIVFHSPDGFEWGYGGSGPADFALNILAMFLPDDPETAFRLHQDFKWKFVAKLPRKGGVIRGEDIRAWLAERGAIPAADEAA